MYENLIEELKQRALLGPAEFIHANGAGIDEFNAAKLDFYLPTIDVVKKHELFVYLRDGTRVDSIEKMEQFDHMVQFYWEERFFIKEAFRNDIHAVSHEIYLFRKLLMLKTAFVHWLNLNDKVKEYFTEEEFKKTKFYKEYDLKPGDNVKTMNWINGRSMPFREFANAIKHNRDYLTEIQCSLRNHSQLSRIVDNKAVTTVFRLESYDLNMVSQFFYGECMLKLILAFVDLVNVANLAIQRHTGKTFEKY